MRAAREYWDFFCCLPAAQQHSLPRDDMRQWESWGKISWLLSLKIPISEDHFASWTIDLNTEEEEEGGKLPLGQINPVSVIQWTGREFGC